MRITIAAIGRLKAGPERELFDRYLGRANDAGTSATPRPSVAPRIRFSELSKRATKRLGGVPPLR